MRRWHDRTVQILFESFDPYRDTEYMYSVVDIINELSLNMTQIYYPIFYFLFSIPHSHLPVPPLFCLTPYSRIKRIE